MAERVEQLALVAQGEAATDEAISRVEKSSADWIAEVLPLVVVVARAREHFTTDAVWYLVDQRGIGKPREPRAMGAVMRRAFADRLCEPTDRTHRSIRPEHHRYPNRVWRSLLYDSKEATL